MNETLKNPTLPLPISGLFSAGNWTLWGPTRSETVPSHKADLAVFRLTGEWPESSVADLQGLLIKTPSQWVYAIKAE